MKKRLLSILLVFVMIFSLMPRGVVVFAQTSDGKTVIAFTSDVHNASNNGSRNRLLDWIDSVELEVGEIDYMGMCGDMGEAGTRGDIWWTYVQAVMDAAENKVGVGNVFYTTGNHEFYNGSYASTSNSVKSKYMVDQEAFDPDERETNFRLYCLGTDNWDNNQDNYTQSQIDKLSMYLESIPDNDYRPIFIITHYPLHTNGGGSGWNNRETRNAAGVINALNTAAARGKTIIFLWGHNHSLAPSPETHYDQFYKPGTEFQYASNASAPFNFYYGAAGCMSDTDYNQQSASVLGKGVVFTIDPDPEDNELPITIQYFNKSGQSIYTMQGGYIGDDVEPVIIDPDDPGDDPSQQIADYYEIPDGLYYIESDDHYFLTTEEGQTYTNGGSGSQQYNYYGLKGIANREEAQQWMFEKDETTGGYYIYLPNDTESHQYLNGTYKSNSSEGYDGTLKVDETSDIWLIVSNGNGGLILKSTNASTGHDAGDKYLSHGNGSSSEENTFTVRSNNSNNTATTIAYFDESGNEIEPEPAEGGGGTDPVTPGTGTKYVLVDRVEAGNEYLIVDRNTAGSGHALSNPGGTSSGADMGSTSVTVFNSGSEIYVNTDATGVIWTATANGNGFDLTNGSDYLEGKSGNVKIFSSRQYPDRSWSYAGNQLQHTGGQNNYVVYYSNGFTSTYNSTSEKVYFYVRTNDEASDVESVSLTPSSLSFSVGKTGMLTPTYSPAGASPESVTWSSSNTAVATVSNGTVIGVGVGTATITVTTDNGKTATATVTVTEATAETYYLTDTLENGKTYLIVDRNTAGSGHALTNPGGTSGGANMGSTNITVQGSGSDLYIENPSANVLWIAATNGSGYNLTNGSDYLEGKGGSVKIFNSSQYPARYWTYSGNQLQHNGGDNTYTVYYSNSFTSTYQNNTNKVYLFAKKDAPPQPTGTFNLSISGSTDSEVDEEVTYSLDLSSSEYTKYATADITLTYDTTRLTLKTKPDSAIDNNGMIRLLDFGEDKDIKEGIYTFTFTTRAEGDAVVTISEASFSTSEDAATADMVAAELGTASVTTVIGHTHDWNNPTYEWADDYSTVTATRTCKKNPSHIESETVNTTSAVTTEAKCTVDGVRTYTSAAFTNSAFEVQTKTETIPATGHTSVTDAAVAPTCTETGLTEGSHCSVCGEVLVAQETVPALGHDLVHHAAQAATCTEIGWAAYDTCTRCDYTTYVEIPVTGHDYEFVDFTWAEDYKSAVANYTCKNNAAHKETVIATVTSETTDATCEIAGKIVYTATVSAEKSLDKEAHTDSKTVTGEALGHDFGDWVVTTEPTCTEAGVETRTCSRCDVTETREVAALGHDYEAVVTAPTCTEGGYTTYTCSRCGDTYKADETAALGHKWNTPTYEWAEDNSSVTATRVCMNYESHKESQTVETKSYTSQPASCEENGVHLYVAIFKQEGFENQQKSVADIPALGHTWGEATYIWSDDYSSVYASHVCQVQGCGKSEIDVAESTSEVTKAATCEEKGETTYTAVFAKDGFETQTETIANIDAIGHAWGEVAYKWADDNSTVTATRICANDAEHVETETVETEYAVVTEATETTAGVGRYTSKSFENEAFEVQTMDVTIQPTGFKVTYEWVKTEDDGYDVNATAVPYAEGAETITETVEAVYAVTVEPTCEKTGVATWTAEFTKDQFTVQTKDVEIEALGHEWGTVSYTWAADNSKVTASRVCAHDETHIETETVNTTSEVTKAATCEEKGETTYTAEFENEAFETQTKTAANIDAIGHAWGEAAYEWADDYSSVTATRVCANNAEHVETEMVETASEVTKDATCEAKGETTYTAEFRNEAFETQTVTVENVDALGHDYVAVVTDPTCTEGGYTTYTCSRCGDSYIADETAALGHKWGKPIWTWAEDYSTAEAKFVCEKDESHVENVEAEVTVEIKSGYVYTATVTGPDGESYSDEKKIEASNITSNNTSFSGKLYLYTYIALNENIKADADAYVSVTFNDVTTSFRVADLLKDLDEQGRIAVKQEVYAAMMRDVMTLQLFNGQGEAQLLTYKETTDVTDGFTFTVLDYLKARQENSTDPRMVELARAAELYGIAAQVYFDYKTDQLKTEDIQKMKAEAATITIPSTYVEELTGTLPAGISKRTKNVMFQSDNALRQTFYFADTDLWKYTFKLNGKTVAPTRRASGQFYIEQQNIASGLLSTVYTFSVSDGTNTFTIKSSALGYAYDRQENSTNQDMVNLAKLLYLYSQAADAYFNRT